MKSRRVLLAALAPLTLAPAAHGDVFLLSYIGHDYWDTSVCYNALGLVTAENDTYLTFDREKFEYTFFMDDVCVDSTSSVIGPPFVLYYLSGGTFDVYCDSLTTHDYGTGLPETGANTTAPSTFIDGEHVLGGIFTGMSILIDESAGTGDLDGTLKLEDGSQIDNIPLPLRDGWTIAGLLVGAVPDPAYHGQIDGDVFLNQPVTINETSWGRLKRLYRGKTDR